MLLGSHVQKVEHNAGCATSTNIAVLGHCVFLFPAPLILAFWPQFLSHTYHISEGNLQPQTEVTKAQPADSVDKTSWSYSHTHF